MRRTEAASEVFTCGVDVGTVNMCLAFVSNRGRVVVYYGPIFRKSGAGGHEARMTVLVGGPGTESGVVAGTIQAYPGGTLVKNMNDYRGFLNLLGQMKEVSNTVSAVVESQVAVGCAKMSRLDGILYGWLSGRGVKVEYKGGGCREGFVARALENFDVSRIRLPTLKARRSKAKEEDVKIASYQFVGCYHPGFYDFVRGVSNDSGEAEGYVLAKIDDICDAVLYAYIAR